MANRERAVSIFDLQVKDVERIERELGLPLPKWGEAPSIAKVYGLIYGAATGRDATELTLRELMDAVALGGDDDPDR